MTSEIPQDLLDEAAEWNVLHRWERSQLGKALRSLGLTYSEIQDVIPVPKGTLSNWSRDVSLSQSQIEAIKQRTGAHTQRGIPKDTQWRRRLEIETIRAEARSFAETHLHDPVFVGGVVLYWGEGAKTRNYLDLTNSDPAALRAFVRWVRSYLDSAAAFVSCPYISTKAMTTQQLRSTGQKRLAWMERGSPRPTSSQLEQATGRITSNTECAESER